MPDFVRELSHAARRLRRAPAFAFTTILVLALGIGATTAVFTIVNGVLVQPLPFPRADRLVSLAHTAALSGVSHLEQSDATYLTYQRHATVFDGMGAYRENEETVGALEGTSSDAERVHSAGVTSSLFGVLGIAPLKGRALVEADDRPDAPLVAVISADLWQRKFGGDPSILGKRLLIEGRMHEIVGIMPATFRFPSADTKIWQALRFNPLHTQAGSFNYTAVGRLKPGVALSSAAAELDGLSPRVLDEFPNEIPKEMWAQAHIRADVAPLRDVIVGNVSRLLWILFGAVGLVLVIACANVANLFLVRAEGRQREIAVRSALGAGRGTLMTQYLFESALVAVAGGAVGMVIAIAGVNALRNLPSGIDLPRLAEVSVNGGALLFALATTLFGTVIVSVIPLVRMRRIVISSVLRESDRAATTGASRQRARSAFVVVQVAMALVLVAGSGLMARSFARLRDVQPGFDAPGVRSLRIAFAQARYPDAASRLRYLDDVTARLAALPSVRGVGITSWLPLSGDNNNSVTDLEDHPLPPNVVPPVHDQANVSAGYFATMHIPLLAGRTFTTTDAAHAPFEAIVTRAFAAKYWKGGSALGKRLRPGIIGAWFTVVGVAGDSHFESLDKPAEEAVYFPLVTSYQDTADVPAHLAIVLRTDGDPAVLAGPVRKILHDVDPTLPTFDERPMSAIVASAFARTRFTMLLLAAASAMALILGAVGIYGVMAYGVSLRRREIGVRLALGARPSDVSLMISKQGVLLAGLGVAIGLGAAVAVTRVMRGLLYDVSPIDPLTLGGACIALLVVSLLASWIPARRAAAVDPAESLRSE